MAKISLRNLRKSYGSIEVLHGVDMEIEDGEFVVIVGPSGCGKSTLLRLVAGLEAVTGGEVLIGERVVNELEPAQRDIAMVFQNYALYPHMTVRENLSYGLRIRGTKREDVKARVETVAASLGISEFLDRKPRQLSGGQRQRVAMGRAIVREPAVFLFDEPLSNLDAKLRVQMRLELELLHQRLETTCLYVTHDQVEAMTLADRMMVLNDGRIEQIGSPAEVYAQPASLFVAGFIGAPPMNLIPAATASDGSVQAGLPGESGGPLWLPKLGCPLPLQFVLGIRPEHLQVCSESEGLFVLTVNVVENLGADSFAYGSLGGQKVVLRLPEGHTVDVGGHVAVRAAANHLHIFDAESGRRMELALPEDQGKASWAKGPQGPGARVNHAKAHLHLGA